MSDWRNRNPANGSPDSSIHYCTAIRFASRFESARSARLGPEYTTQPRLSTIACSVTSSASRADCSTSTTVSASSRMSRCIARSSASTMMGASPSRGSSMSSSAGLPIKARPIAGSCCSPPEIWLPMWVRRSARLGKNSYTRSRVQGPARPATVRFSSTVSDGKIQRPWGTKPIPSRARSYMGSFDTGLPRYSIEPLCSVVCPMMVPSSVDLPTPFRPSTASEPRSGSESAISSSTTVAPYPARTPPRRNKSGMPLTEIDLAHPVISGDFRRRALDEDRPLREHRDALRKPEHHVHVVLYDENGDFLGERVEHLEDTMRLHGWHPCSRLVEQEHARPESERDRDLDQALLSIGKAGHRN